MPFKHLSFYRIGLWLFLVGSVLFVIDSGLALQESVSIRSLSYGCGSVLFALGCIAFLKDTHR